MFERYASPPCGVQEDLIRLAGCRPGAAGLVLRKRLWLRLFGHAGGCTVWGRHMVVWPGCCWSAILTGHLFGLGSHAQMASDRQQGDSCFRTVASPVPNFGATIAGETFTTMKSQILRSSIVVAARNQVSCDLAGEAAILDIKSGIYYGLNAVGARIWTLIQEPRTVEKVREAILEEYDVEPDRCEHDLLALLQELATRGLIEVLDETAA
jgi:hypothetical protein